MHAPSNRYQGQAAMYKMHERERKREREREKIRVYEQMVGEVEHSTFTPLVLSVTGEMGNEATTFNKCLASLLAEKWDTPYSMILNWLKCHLSFSP